MSVYRDRLSATWDKGLFLIAWAVGTAGLFTFKYFDVRPQLIVVWTAIIMLGYALLIWRSPQFKVREDRAGDSCYYLGFLFTLSSLAYALWDFSRTGNDPRAVIANFAVALGSTIIGLVLRVTFQQLREDPFEVEQEARLELSEAARQLKNELSLSVEDFSRLRTALGQELQNEFTKAVGAIADECSRTIQKSTEEQRAAIADSLTAIAASAEAMRTHVSSIRLGAKRLVDSYETVATRLTDVVLPTKPFEDIAASVTVTAAAMERLGTVSSALDGTVKAIDQIATHIASALATWETLLETGTSNWLAATQTERDLMNGQRQLVDHNVRSIQDLQRTLLQAVEESRRAVVKTQQSLVSLANTIAADV